MSETSDYQEQFRKLKAKREEIEREFPIEKAVAVKKMIRLDAVKARLASLCAGKLPYWEYGGEDPQLKEDLERLVAVVNSLNQDIENYVHADGSAALIVYVSQRTLDALAYWMEEI